MIELTKLNGDHFLINIELIETVEETPDTVITLTTSKKLIVKESMATIKEEIISYKRQIYQSK